MPGTHTLQCGPFRVDLTNEQVWHGAAELRLRPHSFAVLRQLLTHAGQLLTKEALGHAVWPEVAVGDKALAVCIGELRKALGDDPQVPRFIATVHRRGYRFIAPVTAVDAAETTPATSASHPPLSPALPALLVGREAELRQLHGWCAQARRGARQVVFVTGEAGTGKTTVVEAFLASLAGDPALRLMWGQCLPHYGAGEAYSPVLEALTDAQPLVLVLEDLHWSDTATPDLVAWLARRREPARLLLLGTYRPVDVIAHRHPDPTLRFRFPPGF